MNSELKGKVHSFESFGTVDGPGIRFVVFFAGCHLRCQYCHNVDMITGKGGRDYTVDEVMEKILKNKPYFEKSGGGVTMSGGDPFFQPAFLKELLKSCKENDIHTAVDSSLHVSQDAIANVMPFTDLFMVSLKHFDNEVHKELTGVPNEVILENLRFLNENKAALRLRFLVLPGYTDTEQNLEELIKFTKDINYECLELLPYHKMGVRKWKALKMPYKLDGVEVPSEERMAEIKKMLEQSGVENVIV